MRFLVTFALPEEFAPWRMRGGFRAERNAAVEAYRARRDGIEVLVIVTGAGMPNADRATSRALADGSFDLVISSGLAGGLREELRPGVIVVARNVMLEDGNHRQPLPVWAALAAEQGASEVTLLTSQRVVKSTEEKRRLGRMADAVEMESFAVLDAAASRGVPAVVIRAVSDPVDRPLPLDFGRVFDARGRLRRFALAAAIAQRPTAIPSLVNLARESRNAARRLAEFLERYTQSVAGLAAPGN